MTTPTELLNTMKKIIGPARRWEKEVRFNSLFDWGGFLVFWANPRNIFQLEETAGAQYLMPQGIVDMTKTLFNQQLNDIEKIKNIKEILSSKGYNGKSEGTSLKRTAETRKVYKQLAELIADYENTEQQDTTKLTAY